MGPGRHRRWRPDKGRAGYQGPCATALAPQCGAFGTLSRRGRAGSRKSGLALAGEVFGFEADGTHHFFAEAIGATGVRVLRLSTMNGVSDKLLPLALQSLVRAQEHLLVLGRQQAVERVAAFLMDMAERQGGLDHFELPMSRMDIADYLGLTIETVSRVFTKLKDKGVIRLPGLRSVEVLKWQALRGLSE